MTDQKLKAYQRKLIALRDNLGNEITRLIDAIPEAVNAPGQPSNLPTHFADPAGEGIEKDVTLVENEEGMLAAVNAAVARIRHGTFGICEGCGGKIPEARLNAIPYASHCISCASKLTGAWPG